MNIVLLLRGRLVRALGVLPLALLCLSSCSGAPAGSVRVAKVVDGDTVVLSTGADVRYIGIDTPETRRLKGDVWVEVDEPFGAEARRANEELVLGKPVRVEFDIERRDKYGRVLGYVWVGDGASEVMAQEELLRRGLAFLYTFPPNVKYVDRFKAAQDEARREKKGLWSLDMVILARDAADHIGERKMVRGAVQGTEVTPDTLQLVMDGIRVIIFRKDIDLFVREGVSPEKDYVGKDVRAFGLIKMHRGNVEMIASHPWQIDII